jgi:hypothetical protein
MFFHLVSTCPAEHVEEQLEMLTILQLHFFTSQKKFFSIIAA